jgi:hypothetical protein
MQEKPQASHFELDDVSRVVLRLAQADEDRFRFSLSMASSSQYCSPTS